MPTRSDLICALPNSSNMAATVVVDIPAVIELEAALPRQDEKVTPASAMSGFRTTANSEDSSRADATRIARVLHAQYALVSLLLILRTPN
jgi:hypothetical protein